MVAVIKVENGQEKEVGWGGGDTHVQSIIPFNPVLRVTISFI